MTITLTETEVAAIDVALVCHRRATKSEFEKANAENDNDFSNALYAELSRLDVLISRFRNLTLNISP